jgi:adenylylsulfate kinase
VKAWCIQAVHTGCGSQTLLGRTPEACKARAAQVKLAAWCTLPYEVKEVNGIYDVTVPGERTMTGKVIWLTGLSGSGKTTIATAIAEELTRRSVPVEVLDGDALRGFMPTGFSREEREAHARRVAFLASRLAHHGVTVVVALISPYRSSRAYARDLCKGFVEVYVATPLEVCEERDAKGLYKKARAGLIREFTGIDDPYEVPEAPELTIDTSALASVSVIADAVIGLALGLHAR